ncbi:lectin subunit alpha-like [Bradysia coprophila]|uniref:lectin subunit alpha-like n=1 Tax=Bradysia coprophila TaxID=38358 RepID=UPI00187DAF58|nr:lectin subunit alpha-like [Bradysia coprophila]
MFKFITIIVVLLQISASMSELQDAMPSTTMGSKEFMLGFFFKANWYRAMQFCRFHGMQLASIESQSEHDAVVGLMTDLRMRDERFWISGNDLANEGNFFWMANGRPLTYTNWFNGEPNHIGIERCVELWNRNVATNPIMWNNFFCTSELFFICERFV